MFLQNAIIFAQVSSMCRKQVTPIWTRSCFAITTGGGTYNGNEYSKVWNNNDPQQWHHRNRSRERKQRWSLGWHRVFHPKTNGKIKFQKILYEPGREFFHELEKCVILFCPSSMLGPKVFRILWNEATEVELSSDYSSDAGTYCVQFFFLTYMNGQNSCCWYNSLVPSSEQLSCLNAVLKNLSMGRGTG